MVMVIAVPVVSAVLLAALFLKRKRKPEQMSFEELEKILYPDGIEMTREEILRIMNDNSTPDGV